MNKLLEQIMVQNKALAEAWKNGYERGFKDGKRADLEKEMAERESPEEEAERIKRETNYEND